MVLLPLLLLLNDPFQSLDWMSLTTNRHPEVTCLGYLWGNADQCRGWRYVLFCYNVPMQPYIIFLEQGPGWILHQLKCHCRPGIPLQRVQHNLRLHLCAASRIHCLAFTGQAQDEVGFDTAFDHGLHVSLCSMTGYKFPI